MPERYPVFARRSRIVRTASALLVAITVAVGAAACTESIEGGGAACPLLCPSVPNSFRDTIIEAVVLDTTISGFPTLGLSPSLLLASRGDTIETRGVIRFDVLPTSFTPNNSGETATITTVDSTFLRIVIDSTGAKGRSQVVLEAYDVDTTETNPSAATVMSLFRADRLIGSLPLTTVAARDTIRIPISNAVLQQKLAAHARLRIGLRISGATSAQLRIVAFSAGLASPLLSFDPSTDTSYIARGISPSTTFGGVTGEELLAASVSMLLVKGTPDAGAQTLSVGGLPGRRSYLRFNIPSAILDSSTIVRADLLLTQRGYASADPRDTIAVVPLIGVSSSLVTDLRRAMELAAPGLFTNPPLDSLLLVPSDSGVRSVDVLGVVRTWAALPANVYRALVLRSSHEGSEPGEARFYSIEAPAGLRPRMRVTYLPRVDRALP